MRAQLFNAIEHSQGIGDAPQQVEMHDVYTSALLATLYFQKDVSTVGIDFLYNIWVTTFCFV